MDKSNTTMERYRDSIIDALQNVEGQKSAVELLEKMIYAQKNEFEKKLNITEAEVKAQRTNIIELQKQTRNLKQDTDDYAKNVETIQSSLKALSGVQE